MRRGTGWIGSGIAMIAIALIMPVFAIMSIARKNPNSVQFVSPAEIDFVVSEPGRYYLWNEYRTVHEGQTYNRSEQVPDGFVFEIFAKETGTKLDFIADTSTSASSASSSGNTVGYVDLEGPGTVVVSVSGDEERVFSFAKSRIGKIVGLVVMGTAGSILLGLGGLACSTAGLVRLLKKSS